MKAAYVQESSGEAVSLIAVVSDSAQPKSFSQLLSPDRASPRLSIHLHSAPQTFNLNKPSRLAPDLSSHSSCNIPRPSPSMSNSDDHARRTEARPSSAQMASDLISRQKTTARFWLLFAAPAALVGGALAAVGALLAFRQGRSISTSGLRQDPFAEAWLRYRYRVDVLVVLRCWWCLDGHGSPRGEP